MQLHKSLILFGDWWLTRLYKSLISGSNQKITIALALELVFVALPALSYAEEDVVVAEETVEITAFTTDLEEGMTNDNVAVLQAFLAADSTIYPEGLITGYFGPLTKAAVTRFQTTHAISTVGRVGPITRATVNRLLPSYRIATVKARPVHEVPVNDGGDDTDDDSTTICTHVPPGHLIAKGWLRTNDAPLVPACQTLPPGIEKKLDDDDSDDEDNGANDENGEATLVVAEGKNNPEASTFGIETHRGSEEITVFEFDLEARGDALRVNEIPIRFDVGGADEDADMRTIADAVYLRVGDDVVSEIDLDQVDDISDVLTFEFNVGREPYLLLNENEKTTLDIVLNVRQGLYFVEDGTTVRATLSENLVDDIDVREVGCEDCQDVPPSRKFGSAEGNRHTFRIEEIAFEGQSALGDQLDDTTGQFTFTFTLEAVGTDFLISDVMARQLGRDEDEDVILEQSDSDLSEYGFLFEIEDKNENTIETGTVSVEFETGVRKKNGEYVLEKGDEGLFELQIEFEPEFDNYYRAQLELIQYHKEDKSLDEKMRVLTSMIRGAETNAILIEGR